MYKQQIINYLTQHKQSNLKLKAVLFDMDGVLFDSMPNHAEAWNKVMKRHNLDMNKEEVYMNEGRTGRGTINLVCQREHGRDATDEEVTKIYEEKSDLFNSLPTAERMKGAYSLLLKVKSEGLIPMVVTGSGQHSLLKKLEKHFPNTFKEDYIISAYDVKHGKPDPEPYLMALKKANISANEAVVVENAPLGVESAVRAGILTLAVNTGPLDDSILLDAGADIVFPSMQALADNWDLLQNDILYCSKNSGKKKK
ncbi:HAD-superfamily hydrolase, subfamily IA, variant 3 [Bacteroides coprosuis DSM 18011]|uniref:HAD-superfamily hydrolase, subfamily IA, variant 3 n=2 Tax=Bacteroides TaxID=816 RepID=F3ZP32_9BACE|nr:HAD-IA family hydrolase [Bacteroides coprosuis]EGJ72605.1 HAD-superfamily hydrolase, subfamily IA, variant 3 [Bacteroides coprosuis DSM 18011]HJD92615.1 HAD-IA family hydrolase [Bacteroides coprosuis]